MQGYALTHLANYCLPLDHMLVLKPLSTFISASLHGFLMIQVSDVEMEPGCVLKNIPIF